MNNIHLGTSSTSGLSAFSLAAFAVSYRKTWGSETVF